MTDKIVFGAVVPELKEQLKEFLLDGEKLEHFQKDADAITRLSLRGLLPPAETVEARQRLAKNINSAILA